MKNPLLIFLIPAVALLAAVSSCSSEGCTNNQNSIPMAGFYDSATGDPLTISGLSVSGVGNPNDSLLLDSKHNAHQVYLPFRGSQTQTAFYFSSGDFSDVVTFHYDSYPYFDGEDCGAMWRYVITDVTHTGLIIDSVKVTDPLITNIERERIMIFLTLPEPEPEE